MLALASQSTFSYEWSSSAKRGHAAAIHNHMIGSFSDSGIGYECVVKNTGTVARRAGITRRRVGGGWAREERSVAQTRSKSYYIKESIARAHE